MKAFIVEHEGHVLGGYSVAFGKDQDEAVANFRKMAADNLPGRDDCDICEVREIAIAPAAYVIFNGDY